jgi:hypothetical protein
LKVWWKSARGCETRNRRDVAVGSELIWETNGEVSANFFLMTEGRKSTERRCLPNRGRVGLNPNFDGFPADVTPGSSIQ